MITFRCYETKTVGIHRWLGDQPPEFRAEIDAVLELIQAAKGLDEILSVKALRGKCDGLTEIKIDFSLETELIHIRILGYETRNSEFILLFPFRKRGGPDYGTACRSAFTRKRGVERDERRAQPCRFP